MSLVKLDDFLLYDVLYCTYTFVCGSHCCVICIDCCITVGAYGSGDISNVVILDSRSKHGALGYSGL